jgi:hypothetical protein
MTSLIAIALELSDRLESGTGPFEVNLLLLGRFGSGSASWDLVQSYYFSLVGLIP